MVNLTTKLKFLILVVIMISAIQVGAMTGYSIAHKPTTKTFEITAQKFKFDPSQITVNKGDTVILRITAIDVTHGFFLDGYGIEKTLHVDEPVTIKFVADNVGKFTYRCAVTCGNFHPYMIGELNVQPNLVFYSGMALLAIITMGMVAMVYNKSKKLAEITGEMS